MKYLNSSPVVIIGMHRSGTTLLTKVLDEYGIFMGYNVEQNSEAIPFLSLNENIFNKIGSNWYEVESSELNISRNFTQLAAFASKKMKSHKFIRQYLQDIDPKKEVDFLGWGWKDPRNTFTLPIYKEIFPNLKSIHIYRNPMDVANSLRNREIKFNKSSKIAWLYHTRKFYFKNGFFVPRAPELTDLEKGIKLWEEYVQKCLSYEDEVLHIKYESFLENPPKVFQKICAYLNLPFDEIRFNNIIRKIDTSRRYSFLRDPDLFTFYNKIKNRELITQLGYNNIKKSDL